MSGAAIVDYNSQSNNFMSQGYLVQQPYSSDGLSYR